MRRLPGIGLAALTATAATLLSRVIGLGTAPVLGIVIGLIVGATIKPRAALRPGVSWSASHPLRAAVVVLGAEVPLAAVASQGLRSLPGIIITLTGCLVAARLLGRRLGIQRRLRALVGVGTSICGASAIAAITPVIDAEQTEVGYAVTTIFLFNIAAVVMFPPLGRLLGLSQHSFGVFAGTAVNDLSSVVATASLYGAGSLHTAVIVKLTRTLMIVPICVILDQRFRTTTTGASAPQAHTSAGQHHAARPVALARRALTIVGLVPGFLIAFAVLAALRGGGLIPASQAGTVSELATLLITLALSAVGLSVDLAALRRAGPKPLLLGAMLWVTVSLLSLGCQAAGLT
ncbi:MAG: YeiH family protein [Solirubrobacteraceae bacterium]